jgi:hypothetical protein
MMVSENFGVDLDHISVGPDLATQRSLRHTGAEISQEKFDDTLTRLDSDSDSDADADDDDETSMWSIDVHVVVGAIDHGDHGDHCLQPILIVRLIS